MPMENARGRGREIVALVILLAGLAAANVVWLSRNKTPPSWDQSAHLSYSLDYYRIVRGVNPFKVNYSKLVDRLLGVSTYWPPFFHFSTLPLTLGFGFSPLSAVGTHILYMILLAFSVYAVGRHFVRGPTAAAAAALTLLFPIVFGLSRTALIDFPLTAMVAFAQAMILKSAAGTRLKSAALLGLAAGLCMMTKWTGPVFFAGTFLLILAEAWKRKDVPRRGMVLSLGLAAAVGAAVVLPWFIKNRETFLQMMRFINANDPTRLGSPAPFSLKAFGWYITDTLRNLLTWPIVPFAGLGLAGLVAARKNGRLLAFLACWILPAYVIFVGTPVKDSRFLVPLLPALGLLTAAGIAALPWKPLRLGAFAALFAVAAAQFAMVSFAWPRPAAYYFSAPPSSEHWPLPEMLDEIEARFGRRELVIGFLAALPYFNAPTFRYFTKIRDLPYRVDDIGVTPVTDAAMEACDLLILKNAGLTLPPTAQHREEFFAVLKERSGRAYGFMDWKHVRLPDRTQAYIFVKERLLK